MKEFNLSSMDKCIPHRNWQSALKESFALLVTAQPGDVVCVIGPSRCGKTRLSQRLSVLLSGGNQYEMTGELPVIEVEAANTGPHGTFSTKSFVHRLLEAVKHPILGQSLNEELLDKELELIHRRPEHELRIALERALRHRRTQYVFIDEAHHARYTTKDSLAVLDSWKCLAQTAQVVLVLFGAYPMQDVIRDSPHMIGRKRTVHLARYQATKDDMTEFARIVQYYQEELSDFLDNKLSLTQHLELLYEGSLGCIGLLRSWLRYAAAMAHAHDGKIDYSSLLNTMLSDVDRKAIFQEIEQGEMSLSISHQSRNPSLPLKREKAETKTKRKPFQRKPKRHPPGGRLKSQSS